jgi:hypothetical protein
MPKTERRELMTQQDRINATREDPAIQLQWANACLNAVSKLTPYEQGFVFNVRGFLIDNRRLSEKQIEILERIYAERT